MTSKSYYGLLLMLFIIISMLSFGCNSDAPDPRDPGESGELDLCIFYGRGCPHCEKELSFLEEMKDRYPDLNVREFEVYFNQQNRELFEDMATSFNSDIQGVPTTFIDDRMFVGFSNSIEKSLEEEIRRCVEEGCRSPCEVAGVENLSEALVISGDSSPAENPEKKSLMNKITIPAVIGAAAVDAINPCAFAVLIILLTTIIAAKKKGRALQAGLAFAAAIFISYFLMGLGLYSAVQVTGLTHIFYYVVAILAIIIGLFNLKDYLWYGKWFIMEVPKSWRPKMKMLLKGVTSTPGAFLIGFVVSLFLLPCTSGPYIVILGLLSKASTRPTAMLLLLLYNLIFILPMLIITFAIYFGFTTTEKAEEWRQRKLKTLHLIAGIIILLLGIGMLFSLYMGWV
ncbi:hypothetical protein GF345_05280 [Candidatus Woesearchaeota archaeon]|nr:hypothetical protein [Candidatus Woesearchaeota archaeon]